MRLVLRLLCLALAPILIVTVPTTAEAATVKGPAVPVSFGTSRGDINPESLSAGHASACNVVGQWVVSTEFDQVHFKAECASGWDAQDPKLRFYPSGSGCTVTSGADYATPHEIEFGSWVVRGGELCTIDQLCWEYSTSSWSSPWHTFHESGCVDWALGAPPELVVDEACPVGTVTSVSHSKPRLKPDGTGAWEAHLRVSGVGTNQTQQWRLGLVVSSPFWNGYHVKYPVSLGYGDGAGTMFYALNNTGMWLDQPNGGQPATWNEVRQWNFVGVQIMSHTTDAHATGWCDVGHNQLPQTVAGGDLGVTKPSACLWYFGQQIADPASIVDPENEASATPYGSDETGEEPGGGELPDPEPVPPSSCDFSFTDPTTWAGGGLCLLVTLVQQVLGWLGDIVGLLGDVVGWLGDMLQALWDLAGDIASAILGGLAGLFMPAEGYLDARVSELKGDFKQTSPGGYVEAVTGQNFDIAAAGCGGIPVDWSISGKRFAFDFLNACGGYMSNIAAIVKLAASAALVIFGGFGCVRAVGAGFGWAPTIGRGADV